MGYVFISAQGLSLQSEEKVKWENAVSHCFSVVGSDQPGLIEQAPPSPAHGFQNKSLQEWQAMQLEKVSKSLMLSSSPLSLLRKAAIWKRIEPVWKQQAGEEDTEDLTLTLSHEMSIYTPITVNLQYPSDHWADQ